MSKIEKLWIATKIFIVVAAFITLTIIDFREMSRQGQPVKAGPMSYDSTGVTRVIIEFERDPCTCELEGKEVVYNRKKHFCLDKLAVRKENYDAISRDPCYVYEYCQDPRPPLGECNIETYCYKTSMRSCSLGDSDECFCPDGGEGTMMCSSDCTSWTPCECPKK